MRILKFESYNPEGNYIEQDSPNMTDKEVALNDLVAKVDGRSIEVSADALFVTDTEHHECEVESIESDGVSTDMGFLAFNELSAEGQDSVSVYLDQLGS